MIMTNKYDTHSGYDDTDIDYDHDGDGHDNIINLQVGEKSTN